MLSSEGITPGWACSSWQSDCYLSVMYIHGNLRDGLRLTRGIIKLIDRHKGTKLQLSKLYEKTRPLCKELGVYLFLYTTVRFI